MIRRRLRRTIGIFSTLSLLVPVTASAQEIMTPIPTFHLQNGQNAGPQEAEGGPGAEQPDVTWVQRDGKTYIISIYMSSKVSEEDGPWQCKCSSVELTADGQPTLVADQVQLTDFDGDRPCNHPAVASDGTNAVWVYGSDKNNATNVSTYVSSVDHMCQMTSDHVRISENANNNEGAPAIIYNGMGRFTAGYLSTGGNDISYAVGLTVADLGGGAIEVDKTWLKGVVTPANIGRPTIASGGEANSLFCAAKGDNRPPEDGVQCAWLDAINGEVMFKQIIAASQPNESIYMNQPTVGALEYGRFAVHVLQSNGRGKTHNEKGSNTTHDYVIEPLADSFLIKDHKELLGSYHTHSSICSGAYGLEGKPAFGILGAPITGNGQPAFQVVNFDAATGLSQDKTRNHWSVGWYADSGKLANLYGQNPHTQGRDFLRCEGDIPNPGFNQPNGYLPHVKTFFATPHAGRIDGEMKNSMWLSLVPGHTSVIATPGPPSEPGSIKAGPEPQGEDPEPPAPAPEDDPAPPPEGNNGDEPNVVLPPKAGGCAVSGSRDDSNAGLGLAMVGLGLALAWRRRKGA